MKINLVSFVMASSAMAIGSAKHIVSLVEGGSPDIYNAQAWYTDELGFRYVFEAVRVAP